jgi:hypothetical protein
MEQMPPKKVGQVTAKQFGHVYIDGVPHNPAKVKRFMTMGDGILLGDIVIYDADSDGVLSYIKNAKYAEGEERALVKQYVKDVALLQAGFDISSVSDEILAELAEEGAHITNDGVITVQGGKVTMEKPEGTEGREEEVIMHFGNGEPVPTGEDLLMDLDPELVEVFNSTMKKDMSILLQSSLKAAIELYKGMPMCPKKRMLIRAETIGIATWIDTNSTRVMDMASKLHTLEQERINPTFKRAAQQ